jgi:hypothetical protein
MKDSVHSQPLLKYYMFNFTVHKWNQSTRTEEFRVVLRRHVVRHAEARMAYIPDNGCMVTCRFRLT